MSDSATVRLGELGRCAHTHTEFLRMLGIIDGSYAFVRKVLWSVHCVYSSVMVDYKSKYPRIAIHFVGYR